MKELLADAALHDVRSWIWAIQQTLFATFPEVTVIEVKETVALAALRTAIVILRKIGYSSERILEEVNRDRDPVQ